MFSEKNLPPQQPPENLPLPGDLPRDDIMPYEYFRKNNPDVNITPEQYYSMTDATLEQYLQQQHEPPAQNTSRAPISRRAFLRGMLGALALTATGAGFKWHNLQSTSPQKDPAEKPEHTPPPLERNREGEPRHMLTLKEQLTHPETLNLTDAYRAEFQHYAKKITKQQEYNALTNGVERLLAKNIPHIIAPFQKHHLPSALAWMIPLKESHFRNVTARYGTQDATGEYQIRPSTARLFQKAYQLDHAYAQPGKNVYRDAELASMILKENYDILGDINLALYAYNAGPGLFGYTEQTKKSQRSQEDFLHYMEQKIKQKLTNALKEQNGIRVIPYKITRGDTLEKIARRTDTSVKELQAINHLTNDKLIAGKNLYVPATNDRIIQTLIPKEYETLTYVPRMYAIQALLKRDNLDQKILSKAQQQASRTVAQL